MFSKKKNVYRWQNVIVVFVLAVSIALILWLTLVSRLGSYSRHYYPMFSSYRAIINGSVRAFLENIGNIVLFLPVGVVVAMFLRMDVKCSLQIGLAFSLFIESCQWFFWLGYFEVDDLLHNTIGAGIGAALVTRTALGTKLNPRNYKKSLAALLCLIVFFLASIITYQGLRWQEMKRLAALNDREDGSKNLLVLSLDPSYIEECDVKIIYNSDGSILIEGSSEKRAWIQIGSMKLIPGRYVLTGLSDTEENTIALVLDAYDPNEGRYRRITQEVGTITESEFVVEEEKAIRALISIYPGNSYSVIARPAVFRTE